MARIAIKEGIYSDLANNSALLALLGPVTDRNSRVYAGWPQVAPALSGNNASEGWLIFYEEQSVIPWETIVERVLMDFHCYATSQSIGEAVIDILDGLYHWRIAGQNSRVFGERNVVMMKRMQCLETFEEDVKLYHKIGRYRLDMVKTPFGA